MRPLHIPPTLLAFVEGAPFPVSLTDARAAPGDNPLVSASAPFFRATGYHPTQLLGRDLRCLQCEESQPAAIAALAGMLRSGKGGDAMLTNVRRSGERWTNYVMLFPVLTAGSEVSHYLGAHFDVPERDAAQRLAMQLDLLINELPAIGRGAAAGEECTVSLDTIADLLERPGQLADAAARRLVLARVRAISVAGIGRVRKLSRVEANGRGRSLSFGSS